MESVAVYEAHTLVWHTCMGLCCCWLAECMGLCCCWLAECMGLCLYACAPIPREAGPVCWHALQYSNLFSLHYKSALSYSYHIHP